jgi:hypothetical protein|nr:MAG TPA: Transcriptional regulator, MarR/EmrR family, emrR, transcriptional regulator, DNA-binding [Bacteriophage sp.]
MNEQELNEGMSPVELLNQVACSMTQQRLGASQVAVLTSIALNPAITSGPIVDRLGMSVPNIGRILNYLINVGDITCVYEQPPTPEYPTVRRHFYITPSGVITLRRVLNYLGWSDMSRFRVLERLDEQEIYKF